MPKNPETEGSPRLMTVKEIAEEHDVSRVSIHTYRRRGVFPQPVEGEGTTRLRFRSDEVAAFFAANPKQPGKRTDRTPKPQQQGDPVTARQNLYAFAMRGKEQSPNNSEEASARINDFRAASLGEAVEALRAKAQELSAEAEEEMRRDLEEKAQEWHRAAELVARLARKTPMAPEV